MIKVLGLGLGILIASVSALAQSGGAEVAGKVEGIKSGRLYLLTQRQEGKVDTLAATDFKGGRFTLCALVEEPMLATLAVGGYSGGFDFFVEPKAKYEALLKNGAGWYIRGAELQRRWSSYQEQAARMVLAINEGRGRYEALRAEGKFRSASKLNDTISLQLKAYEALQSTFQGENDNVLTAYVAQSQAESKNLSLEESLRLYEGLGAVARASASGRLMYQRIQRLQSTRKGQKAPDFSIPDREGKVHTLSQIPGKIKIVDFWASWCGPCKLSNQKLKGYYAELAPKGLVVLGVSLDDNRDKWLKAIEAQGLPWMHVCDLKAFESEAARLYNVKSIPALFVLDEDNNIIARDLKGEALYKFLKERLP